jgi:hypothetical protein
VRHVRMLGLCLAAVFAVAAIAATSASALPEWGQCFKKGAGGKYTDSNCTKKASSKSPGEFEWRKSTEVSAANKKFEGHNVGSGGVLTTEFALCEGAESVKESRIPRSKCTAEGGEILLPTPQKIECESESNHGEATGTKEVKNVTVVFRGCKLFGTTACSNGSEEGEIAVNLLKGSLGYISKSKKEVGVLLEPAAKKQPFATFICGGFLSTVVGVGNEKEGAAYSPEKTGGYDGIISPIAPINRMTAGLTQTYTINEETFENIPSKLEGKHIELLEDYQDCTETPEHCSTLWEKAGETITNENKQSSGEEVEIKA